MKNIKVVAFDADDTLWVNEPYFQEAERKFCELLKAYMPSKNLSEELFKTEMQNLTLYGYGAKSFTLSMVETALRVSHNKVDPAAIEQLMGYGRSILAQPVELLDGVEEVLQKLSGKYKLVVATKGDLLDQQQKLKKSGLEPYFHHIEIMSNKQEDDYVKLLSSLACTASSFLMVGNSLKSDVLPVLALGGYAVHVPYHTTWAHEKVDEKVEHANFLKVSNVVDILPFLL